MNRIRNKLWDKTGIDKCAETLQKKILLSSRLGQKNSTKKKM